MQSQVTDNSKFYLKSLIIWGEPFFFFLFFLFFFFSFPSDLGIDLGIWWETYFTYLPSQPTFVLLNYQIIFIPTFSISEGWEFFSSLVLSNAKADARLLVRKLT